MKTSQFIYMLNLILIFCSCGQKQENIDSTMLGYDFENYQDGTDNPLEETNTTKMNTKTKGYQVMNQQFGIPVGIMPIPSSWKVIDNKKDKILFESPNGIKVFNEGYKSYYFSNDQQVNYFYSQQNNIEIKPVKNLDRLLKEDIVPLVKSQGLQLVNQFSLPELAQFDQRFDSYLYKSTPENRKYQCVAAEFVDQKGTKSIGIIRYYNAYYPATGGMGWGYTLNSMEAPASVYEQAKKDYINALVNFQINPQWVQASNQYYAQLTQQSTAAHQQRMAAIKSYGQTTLNNGNTYSSILDSNHESWKRRNGINDAGHANSINSGIWERTTVTNPNTDQGYQVEGNNNYYWMNNNNGEYIGSDNSLYNPNLDNNVNNQDWTQYDIDN